VFNPLRRPVASLLIAAAIVRAAVMWGGFDQLRDDPDAYNMIGRTLAQSGTFGAGEAEGIALPTAFRPPLYPAMLAVIHGAIIATGDEKGDPLTAGNPLASQIAIAMLHILLSLATVVTTYLVALRLLNHSAGRDPHTGAAMLASLLVIGDPILLQGSVLVMTETLATLLAVTALHLWLCLVDRLTPSAASDVSTPPHGNYLLWASGLGTALGLAYLCRPTFIVWTFLLVAYLVTWAVVQPLWRQYRQRLRATDSTRSAQPRSGLMPLAAALVVSLTAGVFLAGWTLRNHQQLGRPVWATTHGGYTLLLGNNPSFFQYMRTGQVGMAWNPNEFFTRWEAREIADPRKADYWTQPIPIVPDPAWQAERSAIREQAKSFELVEDRLAYETARAAIANDFKGFVQATLWRIGRLLSPMPQMPSGGSQRMRLAIIAVTLFYVATIGLAIWGLLILGKRIFHPPWAGAMLLIISLTAVHAFYWTNMRMRAPAIPVLAVLAAIPLCRQPGRVAATPALSRKH